MTEAQLKERKSIDQLYFDYMNTSGHDGDAIFRTLYEMNRRAYENPLFRKYGINDRWTFDHFKDKLNQRSPQVVGAFVSPDMNLDSIVFFGAFSFPHKVVDKTYVKFSNCGYGISVPEQDGAVRRKIFTETLLWIINNVRTKDPNVWMLAEIPVDSQSVRRIVASAGFSAVKDKEELRMILTANDVGFDPDSLEEDSDGVAYSSKRRHSGLPYVKQYLYINKPES